MTGARPAIGSLRIRENGAERAPSRSPSAPLMVGDIELAGRLSPLRHVGENGRLYRGARVLVRLHGQPLGSVDVALPATPAALASAVAESALWGPLVRHLRADGLPVPAPLTVAGCAGAPAHCRFQLPRPAPHVTVVIATRDRPDALQRALRAVLQLDYPSFDVLVVDSASRDERARRVVEAAGPTVRYLREERPGLSRARNRGLREAEGTLIAFTDDDMTVDGSWLRAMVRGFARGTDVACVTGIYLPGRLETPGEVWFDRHLGFEYEPRLFDLHANRVADGMYPYAPGVVGVGGGNMAFRTAALRGLGGFHAALGAGTPTCAGEDLHIVLSVLLAGRRVAYEPAAIIRHHHAIDSAELHRLLRSYGTGITAMLTARAVERPREAAAIARRAPAGLRRVVDRFRGDRAAEAPSPSRTLLSAEVRGMLRGPVAYGRSRRAVANGAPRR